MAGVDCGFGTVVVDRPRSTRSSHGQSSARSSRAPVSQTQSSGRVSSDVPPREKGSDITAFWMNRARQAAITTELMEIVSGAEALKG